MSDHPVILNQNGRPYRADGWINPGTGYGGADDNIENTRYAPDAPLTQGEIDAHYQGNGLLARGIEAPVKDRLSKGVMFITNDDATENRRNEIEQLGNDIEAADMWGHLIEAKFWGRKDGGAIIYFDYGDDQIFNQSAAAYSSDSSRFVNFELRDSQRGLPNKIWVVDRWLAFPMSYYRPEIHGPDHPKIGEPEVYQLTLFTTGYSRLVLAHESRCIVVDGLPLSNRARAQNIMWGNSVLNRVYKVARYYGISLKAMADILEDYNYKSLEIENLTDLIKEGAWDVIGHSISLAAKNQHNQNLGVHAPGTKLIKTTTTVTGITDIVIKLVNALCGEFGIPYSRLLSAEGGALAGSSADTDVENYHESLRYDQKHIDARHIKRFIWMLNYDPKTYPFVFPPLREMNLKEQVETEAARVEMYKEAVEVGMILPEEAAMSMWSTPEANLSQTIVDFEKRKNMTNDEEDPENQTNIREPEEEEEDRADMADDDLFDVSDAYEIIIEEEAADVA